MKIVLFIFIVLGGNNLKLVQYKEVDSVEECVNASLQINQDQSVPYNAACSFQVRKTNDS